MNAAKKLLFLSTIGIYPEFDALFRDYQLQVTKVQTLRKALSLIKQIKPDIIVAEFVYAPTYGSQLSNFESLFAAAQSFAPGANFIALVDRDDLKHFKKVSSNVGNCQALTLPVKISDLADALNAILTGK